MNLRNVLTLFILSVITFNVSAEDTKILKEKSNLMFVVRTSFGANKVKASLVPTGVQTFQDSNGKTHSFEMAHYEYLGDTHIRFVFDSTETMVNTRSVEFKDLGLTPENALEVAIENIYREYGQPKIYKLENGVFQVQGKSPDFDSSYFVDKALWQSVASHFKERVIVAVPARDLLLFAPASDKNATDFLVENIKGLFDDSGHQAVSSALYSYRKGVWKVHKPPTSQR